MLPEFFTLRNWDRFCLYLNNQRSHGQMDATAGFSASNWSKTNPPRFSECRLLMLYKGLKMCRRNFFNALRLWRCSGQPCNNQQSYGQMDVIMVGFSRSERSRNNLGSGAGEMFPVRDYIRVRCDIQSGEGSHPGEVMHLGEGSHPGEAMHPDTMFTNFTIQYMMVL